MPVYDDLNDDLNRGGSFPDAVERCRRDYVATQNPLYAWEAWLLIRFTWRSRTHERIELPEWLGKYFDDCGHDLLGRWVEVEGSRQVVPTIPAEPGEGPGFIGSALRFREGLAKAREHWGGSWDQQEKLAMQAIERMWHDGLTLDRAAQVMQDETEPGRQYYPPSIKASRPTIKRAVGNAKRYALRQMQSRLRDATGTVPARSKIVREYSLLCKSRGGDRSENAQNTGGKLSGG